MFNPLKYFSNRKVGLVLGSGAAKGISHISVIEYLKKMDIPIDMIAGSSIGALIGAIYACGNLDRAKNDLISFDWKDLLKILDFVFPKSGIIEGTKITKYLSQYIPDTVNFEDLPIKLNVIATDFISGDAVIFNKGNVLNAVRASISIPGIFEPVNYNGCILIDGGVANPIPVNIVKQMGAGKVIAVNLHPTAAKLVTKKSMKAKTVEADDIPETSKIVTDKVKKSKIDSLFGDLKKYFSTENRKTDNIPSIVEVMSQSIDIMEFMNTQMLLKYFKPDVLIQPNLSDIKTMDFYRASYILSKGTIASEEMKRNLLFKVKYWI